MAGLQELADLVGGRLVGDAGLEIGRVAPIDEAGEGDITFLSNSKYLPALKRTGASAVIVGEGVEVEGKAHIVCPNPYLAFAKILTRLQPPKAEPCGVMAGAVVAPSAVLAEEITVHPGCVIGENVSIGRGCVLHPGVVLYDNVTIGENCILHAGVTVREGCRIGNRVIIQPSAIIGGDGFGYAPDGRSYYKIPQVGIVVLEDDVEIGSATCIDRAALGVTLIKRGVKIDNLVQVGHNVVVGEDTIVVSQVGISGSTKIGAHCTFGGQSATIGHLTIGDNVTVAGRGGVTKSVEGNQFLSGFPVMPHKEWLRASAGFAKLPEMRKGIERMKRRIEELEKMVEES